MRRTGLIAAASILLSAASAAAQTQVKSRVMVLVDTSSSMIMHFGDNLSCGGDGDFSSLYTDGLVANRNWYPGYLLMNGQPDGVNSRMYAAKKAVYNAVNSTGNLDFGLMRYAIRDLGGCPDLVKNCCTFANPRCVVVGYYIGADITYWGGCGPLVNNVPVDGGQILVVPSAASSAETLSWVDNVEDFRDRGDGWPLNGELRGQGTTPLAGSVRTATEKWYRPILTYTRANPGCDPATDPLCDPQIDCRPYVFIAMTDGGDSCEPTATQQDKNPPLLAKQLYDLNPKNPVKTYVVALAISTPSNITVMNNMAVSGGTGAARFANSQDEIESAFADIAASSVKYEVCNGRDDNCDGRADEGFDLGDACSVGEGRCLRAGIKKCDPTDPSQTTCCVDDKQALCAPLSPGAATPEICNGLDDDCNGLIDDGGVCQKCQPTAETCDGKDNDCDGKIDNALIDEGRPCGFSLGTCLPGATRCVADPGKPFPDPTDHLICVGGTLPATERCNGLDDDCDGVADGMSRVCYSGLQGTEGVGACRGGEQACLAVLGSNLESWGACVGEVRPVPEICNGIDDDCNGTVDDAAGVGTTCCPSGRCGIGLCRAGTLQCSGGRVDCVGGQGPQGEVCNGLDDDCNGIADDLRNLGAPCQPNGGCAGKLVCDLQAMEVICQPLGTLGKEVCNGFDDDCDGLVDEEPDISTHDARIGAPCGNPMSLPLPCAAGKNVCRGGEIACEGEVGPASEVCDCKDNDCNVTVDDNAACPPGTACHRCACYAPCDVGEFPCPGGYECDAQRFCVPAHGCNPPCTLGFECKQGVCVDRCDGVTCPPDGYLCMNGICVDVSCVARDDCASCRGGAGERCDRVARKCVPDPCCGKVCGGGEFCDPSDGRCIGVCLCDPDRACVAGRCVEPLCTNRRCPPREACDPRTGACVPDRCQEISCSAGFVCVDGSCLEDLCPRILCPEGTRCVTNSIDGTRNCYGVRAAEAPEDQVVGTGSGGFAFGCSAGGAPRWPGGAKAAGLLALALLVPALRRVRRRATVSG